METMRHVWICHSHVVTCTHLFSPATVHCDCRIQFSEAIACPGEIVTITCTTPTQTHQWRVLDLEIYRGLAAADGNRVVPPDFPFQFAVIAVMQNGSIISTGTVNFTANLNGTTVSCRDGYLTFPIEQRTTIMLKGKENGIDILYCKSIHAGITWKGAKTTINFRPCMVYNI